MAVEKAMADDALREFEVSHGMVTPETSQDAPVDQGARPGSQDPRTPSRDLSRTRDPRRSHEGRRPWRPGRKRPPVSPHAAHARFRRRNGAGDAVPWLPRWAREFSDQFFAGTTCVFLLHGNVHDLTRQERDGSPAYGGVTEFLATQLFGKWDVVLQHDLSLGLKAAAGGDGDRLRRMLVSS